MSRYKHSRRSQWEKKVLSAPGAAERVRAIENELRHVIVIGDRPTDPPPYDWESDADQDTV